MKVFINEKKGVEYWTQHQTPNTKYLATVEPTADFPKEGDQPFLPGTVLGGEYVYRDGGTDRIKIV